MQCILTPPWTCLNIHTTTLTCSYAANFQTVLLLACPYIAGRNRPTWSGSSIHAARWHSSRPSAQRDLNNVSITSGFEGYLWKGRNQKYIVCRRSYIVRKLKGEVGIQPCHGSCIVHLRQPAADAVALPLAEREETFRLGAAVVRVRCRCIFCLWIQPPLLQISDRILSHLHAVGSVPDKAGIAQTLPACTCLVTPTPKDG